MTRFRGRSPRGHRLVTEVPHGHWKMTTLVAGLRHNGITAPLVVDGPMNGDVFRATSSSNSSLPFAPATS